jgi:CheY-like chemotaxis protein
MVECYGYEAITADDGYEAIEIVKQYPRHHFNGFDNACLDGVVATEIIRNLEHSNEIPIIAMTAYNDLYQNKAMEAGCNEVVSKPLNFSRLKPLVNHYLL